MLVSRSLFVRECGNFVVLATCAEFKGFLRDLEGILGFCCDEGAEVRRDLSGRRGFPERPEELAASLESGDGFRRNNTQEEAEVEAEEH